MKKSLAVLLCLFTTSSFAMNKAELIEAIASDAGLSKADAKRALDGFSKVSNSLYQKGEPVSVPGLGTVCKVKEKANRTKCGSRLSSNFTPNNSTTAAAFRIYFSEYSSSMIEAFAADIRKEVLNNKNSREQEEGFGGELDNGGVTFNPLATGGYHQIISTFQESQGNLTRELDPAMALQDAKSSSYFFDKWQGEWGVAVERFNVRQEYGQQSQKRAMAYYNVGSQALAEKLELAKKEAELGRKLDNSRAIIEKVKSITGMEKEVDLVFKHLAPTVQKVLARGESVKLVGFGSFSVSKRAARTGRNPQTGKEIKIAAKNVVRFKAGADLSKKVN